MRDLSVVPTPSAVVIPAEQDARQMTTETAHQLAVADHETTRAARMLATCKDQKLYEALGYRSWSDYCEAEFSLTKRSADRLIQQGRVIDALEAELGTRVSHVSVRLAAEADRDLPAFAAQVRELVNDGMDVEEAMQTAASPEGNAHDRPAAFDIRGAEQEIDALCWDVWMGRQGIDHEEVTLRIAALSRAIAEIDPQNLHGDTDAMLARVPDPAPIIKMFTEADCPLTAWDRIVAQLIAEAHGDDCERICDYAAHLLRDHLSSGNGDFTIPATRDVAVLTYRMISRSIEHTHRVRCRLLRGFADHWREGEWRDARLVSSMIESMAFHEAERETDAIADDVDDYDATMRALWGVARAKHRREFCRRAGITPSDLDRAVAEQGEAA